jgi:DNA-directed RNA polymerase subunit alpha
MLIIQRPTVETIGEEEQHRQSFTVGPLDPGFGHTLGNSLRRTLLSSIPGAAATQVRFDAALHEFTTIEGVKEDVTDILLNLKDMILQVHSDEPVVIRLDKRGPGDALASDFQTSSDVEILNGDLRIATLNAQGHLALDVTVERGKGYVSAERNKRPGAIGAIPLEPVRVEQSTDFDQLVLEIETDGSISPREALASAGATLRSLFDLVASLDEESVGLELGDVGSAASAGSELDYRIEELGLTERARNCLKRGGINTVAELINCTASDLLSITNFGQTSLKDVTDRLDERGLALRSED